MSLKRLRTLLCLSACTALVLPVRQQGQTTGEKVVPPPAPTGVIPIGTLVAYLIDTSRTDSSFPAGRPVTLQLWYPAARRASPNAPYLWERGLDQALRENQYYGVDSAALDRWSHLITHSIVNAEPKPGKHPLLAFSVGLGVIRANYTSIAEELASYGYIVALVESPQQGLMVLSGGRALFDTSGRYGDVAAHRRGVEAWSRDISFVLDRLATPVRSSSLRTIAQRIDWSEVGALGHSSGGLVAVAACERDSRIKACADMDGGMAGPDQQPLAEFVAAGVTKPTLFLNSQPLYDDTTLARRGMTREQWVKRGEAGKLVFDAFVSRSRGRLVVARVAGTGHFSFSDAPYVMPSAIARFGGRIIAPDRGRTVITSVLRAFFDQELRGRGGGVAPLIMREPELTVSSSAP
jgi:predicted dienelactone hydrolase